MLNKKKTCNHKVVETVGNTKKQKLSLTKKEFKNLLSVKIPSHLDLILTCQESGTGIPGPCPTFLCALRLYCSEYDFLHPGQSHLYLTLR